MEDNLWKHSLVYSFIPRLQIFGTWLSVSDIIISITGCMLYVCCFRLVNIAHVIHCVNSVLQCVSIDKPMDCMYQQVVNVKKMISSKKC